MTPSKLKKLIYALQEAISADPALAKPSYTWCRNQVLPQVNFARNDWAGFVSACKHVARKAG